MGNLTLDLGAAPAEFMRSNYPEPGDVYSKAGGQPGFWVVVSVTQTQCCVMAFDMEGQVTGASRYGLSYFRDNSHRRVRQSDYNRGRNANLGGKPFDAGQNVDWCNGWSDTEAARGFEEDE